jgi:hypothetical protein
MSNSVTTVHSLDINQVIITEPKINKNNKQLSSAILNKKTSSGIYIETPTLMNPFGVSSYDGGKAWSIALNAKIIDEDKADDIQKLFSFLKELDEMAIDFVIKHSQAIFKKKYDESQRSIVNDLLFHRCVQPSVKDGNVYPDIINCKINKIDEANPLPDLLIYKESNVPLNINSWDDVVEAIPRGLPVKAIIQPRIYFINGKAGINFRLLQVLVPKNQKPGRPIGFGFTETFENKETSKSEIETIETIEAHDTEDEEVANVEYA